MLLFTLLSSSDFLLNWFKCLELTVQFITARNQSFGQVNTFRSVCHFVHRGRESAGGVCLEGVLHQGSIGEVGRPSPSESEKRVVHILLECFLVLPLYPVNSKPVFVSSKLMGYDIQLWKLSMNGFVEINCFTRFFRSKRKFPNENTIKFQVFALPGRGCTSSRGVYLVPGGVPGPGGPRGVYLVPGVPVQVQPPCGQNHRCLWK